MFPESEHDKRWDMHTERQIAASKGGAAAVTLLNSGSWLALLSQTSSLSEVSIGPVIGLWGAGALFGTLLWLFIYRGTLLSWVHDRQGRDQASDQKMTQNIRLGVTTAILSLGCFGAGVALLTCALT